LSDEVPAELLVDTKTITTYSPDIDYTSGARYQDLESKDTYYYIRGLPLRETGGRRRTEQLPGYSPKSRKNKL